MNKLILTLTVAAASFSLSAAPYSHFFSYEPEVGGTIGDITSIAQWNIYATASATDLYATYGTADMTTVGSGPYFGGLSDGTSITSDGTDHAGFLGGNDAGFMFASADNGTGITPGGWMFTTTYLNTGAAAGDPTQFDWYDAGDPGVSLAGATLADVTTLTTTIRQRSEGDFDYRFAMLVDGAGWLVSDFSFSAIETGNSGAQAFGKWEANSLDIASSDWFAGVFTPGSLLDLDLSDNTAQPLGDFGLGSEVLGYGIYVGDVNNAERDSWVRFNSYHVEVVPEPSALALLGLGGLALALIRRRR